MVKIRILAQPRSGSTFLLNVFREIFGKESVVTNHRLATVRNPNVIIYRDIRDSVLSLARVHSKMKSKELLPVPLEAIQTEKGIDEILNFYNIKYLLSSSDECISQLKRSNVLILRYEDFYGNYEYLFDKIENYFKIKIETKQRDKIIQSTNIDHFKKIQEDMPDFTTFDKLTMIHGNHIYKGEIGGWSSFITDSKIQGYYTRKLHKQLKGLGYLRS